MQPGFRTIVDALEPFAEALQNYPDDMVSCIWYDSLLCLVHTIVFNTLEHCCASVKIEVAALH